MMKMPIRWVAKSLVNERICEVASAMPKTAATEVFLINAIWTLASGGTDARNACGGPTCDIAPQKGSPMARAGLGLAEIPHGVRGAKPERSTSHTKSGRVEGQGDDGRAEERGEVELARCGRRAT